MSTTAVSPAFLASLRTLFTRAFHSAASYVFDSQPFTHADDAPLLASIEGIVAQERRHARWLGQVHDAIDQVPEAAAFPYWYRDLNYLTVPYMGAFLAETLDMDLALYDEAMRLVPEPLGLARTMLESIRAEKAEMLETLRPLVARARELELGRYAAGIAEAKAARAARAQAEKERKAALRQKKAPPAAKAPPAPVAATAPQTFAAYAAANGVLDPDEDGIDNKEKGKRKVLWGRAKKKWEQANVETAQVAPASETPGQTFAAYAAANGVLDPEEDGIDNKEKGKRKVLWGRAKKKWEQANVETAQAAPASAASASTTETFAAYAAANGVLDPDEAGIDNKEKGKRKVLWGRAKKKWEKANAETAPPTPVAAPESGAAVSTPPTFAAYAAENGVLDPEEPGLDNKEKGKRKVLWGRAKKKWEQANAEAAPATPVAAPESGVAVSSPQTFAAYAAENGVLDPEEPGLDNKEKGKRKVLWNRARKKWEQAQGGA